MPVVFVESAPVNLVAEEVRSTGKNVDSEQDQEGKHILQKLYKTKGNPKP